MMCLTAWVGEAAAQETTPSPEEQLRAAFLYKFLFFADWPNDDRDERVLCLRGAPSQFAAFDPVQGRTIGGRKLVVIALGADAAVADFAACHLLYLDGEVSLEYTRWILRELATKPVLTVGMRAEFADLGGMVRFVSLGERLGFEVNMDATKLAGIHLKSSVLELAHRRYSSGEPDE